MSDEQNHNRPLEEELMEFPKYEMKSEKVDEIYDHILCSARQLDLKDQKKKSVNKVAVALTSVAAVILIALVSINMLDDNTAGPEKNEAQHSESGDAGDFEGSTMDDADTGEVEDEEQTEGELSGEEKVRNKAEEAMTYLAGRDMEALSIMVHEDQGVLFSPYVSIPEEAQVFNQKQVSSFFNDDTEYKWGIHDGRGNPIIMTPEDYYTNLIYSRNFLDADEINYNEFKQRSTIKNNIEEKFPDSQVVEYYVEPSEEGGFDWRALNLVFKQNSNGDWKLVAIVQDQHTI